MLGEEEKKHLAIAAACGVAIGAIAGAVGYATLSQTSPSVRSRTNSCAGSGSPSRSLNVTPFSRSLLANVSGSDSPSPDAQEMTRALLELSRRMETLEQAVSKKLLSRSGSSLGYLTAAESADSDDDDDFKDPEDIR